MKPATAAFCLLAISIATAPLVPAAEARGQYVYYWPSTPEVVDAMLTLAGVTADDVVYDLGSGDGRIVIRAAERHGARAVGIEQDPALVAASRESARRRHVDDRATFRAEDFFTADISDATVVMLYLTPSLNAMLEPKLRRDLRPGTRIVSNQFGIGTWVPKESVRPIPGTELFLWTVPRRPARTPDIPFTPTPQAVAAAMLDLARVAPSDVVYDLGSGDGRIVILAAQRFHARGVGIEIDPELLDRARAVARDGGVDDRVTFVEGDLLTADLSQATVVTLALSPALNHTLAPRLLKDLRPGTRVVSCGHPIDGWTPNETLRTANGTMLYLWTIPPR